MPSEPETLENNGRKPRGKESERADDHPPREEKFAKGDLGVLEKSEH